MHRFVYLFLSFAMALSACSRAPQSLVLSGPTMGTTYTVRWLETRGSPSQYALRREVEGELNRIDAQMSRYRADSEISRFNAARTTEKREISPELAELLDAALTIGTASQGAFDVAIAPLVDAWGFGPQQTARVPSTVELRELVERCAADDFELTRSPAVVRKRRPDVEIDVNAIAPGYAADLIARIVERHGIENYLIDMGGEIRLKGHNANGSPWRIAIDDPRHAEQVPYAAVSMSAGAISTSGGYRHFRLIGGRRYSHLIDPRTGRPASLEIGSVVVIAPSAAAADGWSTAMFVLGERAGIELAREQNLAVLYLIVDRAGGIREHASPAFEAYELARAR